MIYMAIICVHLYNDGCRCVCCVRSFARPERCDLVGLVLLLQENTIAERGACVWIYIMHYKVHYLLG
jgi:hypothetical protein